MRKLSFRLFSFHVDTILQNRIRRLFHANKLLASNLPIVIAVSGGSDSVALLHILSSLFPEIQRIAVYIDHGLRPEESPAEKELVRTMAAECSATFLSIAVDVIHEQKKNHTSLEEEARNLRYNALETIRSKYNGQCIAVGHTADDQAEEVLLRLIRGSGSAGLGGMAIKNKNIIRPLLQESKETLRNYLSDHNIAFCEDSSNTDTRFLRNKIRRHLLPILEQNYNTSIRQTLLQTASILHEENDLLDDLADTVFQKTTTRNAQKIVIDSPSLCKEHIAIRRRVFEKVCWQMNARPTFKQITSLLDLLHATNNSELHLANGLRASKQQNRLLFHYPSLSPGYRGSAIPETHFTPLTIPSPGKYLVPELGHELLLKLCPCPKEKVQRPDTLLLDAGRIHFPLVLRRHKSGESFHPLGAPGTKKISRFLTDQKIPAIDKANYPVLFSAHTVLAITGLRIDHEFRITDTSQECLRLQWRKINNSSSKL